MMRCPACSTGGSLGLLQRHRRQDQDHRRYFCRQCCAEICYQDDYVVSVLNISEEGDVVRRPLRFWKGIGFEPGLSATP